MRPRPAFDIWDLLSRLASGRVRPRAWEGYARWPTTHHHDHGVSPDADKRRVAIALGLILAFMTGEVVAAIVADSLALLSDAAHMLTDAGALALSLVAMRLAARPAAGAMTFGLKRAEILSALVNGATWPSSEPSSSSRPCSG